MPVNLEPILAHVPLFMLVLFRLTGIFIYAPMYASSVIPARVRILLAVSLAFCIYPLIPPQMPMELSLMTMGFAIAMELLIGLIIGFGALMPLLGVQLGGVIVGQQLGLGAAQIFNPDFGEQTEVIGQAFYMVAFIIFLLFNGHHILMDVLVNSFRAIPLGGYVPDQQLLHLVSGLLQSMFELAIRVAAPVLCVLFLQSVTLGFIARTVPQLNILSLGFPLRIMIGMFVLIASIASVFTSFTQSMTDALHNMAQYFGG